MFASVDERAREILDAQSLRWLQVLLLSDAMKLVRRARRKNLCGELFDAELDEVGHAFAAFVEAVAQARARLGSDPAEN